jgi:hypothetical protein
MIRVRTEMLIILILGATNDMLFFNEIRTIVYIPVKIISTRTNQSGPDLPKKLRDVNPAIK